MYLVSGKYRHSAIYPFLSHEECDNYIEYPTTLTLPLGFKLYYRLLFGEKYTLTCPPNFTRMLDALNALVIYLKYMDIIMHLMQFYMAGFTSNVNVVAQEACMLCEN